MSKSNKQNGMTLVELLIAMGLGIFLMAGVLQVFLGSKQTYTTINAQSHMQENGRFAMDFMSRTLRHGGYLTEISIDHVLDDTLRAETLVADVANGFVAESAVTGLDNVTGIADVKAGTDVVRVRIEGAADDQVTDCEGSDIDENDWANVSYFVNDDGEFRCQTVYADGRSGTVTLVEGVDDLQVQYGVNVGGEFVESGDEQILIANKIVNADATTITDEDWKNVVSIRVALLASSADTPLERSTAHTYDLLDSPTVTYQDGKARQIFTQTINLRNPVYPVTAGN